MGYDYKALANKYIQNLTPYQPGKPIEEVERELGIKNVIKLASNENPLGASPKALAAALMALQKAHIYPDGSYYTLCHELANFLKISPKQITVGNGSDSIIELIARCYLAPGDHAIISEYAFFIMALAVKISGAIPKIVPAKHYAHDIDGMLKAVDSKTRIIFVANPNNPTGTYINKKEFATLMQAIDPKILVVIDEAYYEYSKVDDYPDTVAVVNKYPNLIITRTFSKAYGLAGMRLGYAISSPEIADILNRTRLAFVVSSITVAAGIAALQDTEHLRQVQMLTIAGLQQIQDGLRKMNIDYISKLGNFITFDTKTDALKIYQELLLKGIIVRPLLPYNMPSFLRVSVGTPQQNSLFLQALEEVMQQR